MNRWAFPVTYTLASLLYLWLFVYINITDVPSTTLSTSEVMAVIISAWAYKDLGMSRHSTQDYGSLFNIVIAGLLLVVGLGTLLLTEENSVLSVVSGLVLILTGAYRTYAVIVSPYHNRQNSKETT